MRVHLPEDAFTRHAYVYFHPFARCISHSNVVEGVVKLVLRNEEIEIELGQQS